MERPGVVWVFTIAIILGILWELLGFYGIISGTAGVVLNPLLITFLVVELILLVLRGIMIAQFFMLKKSAQLWTHISFGTAFGVSIIQYIIYAITSALLIPPSLLGIALYIFFWWAVVDYIKKKQLNGKPLFN